MNQRCTGYKIVIKNVSGHKLHSPFLRKIYDVFIWSQKYVRFGFVRIDSELR